MTHFLSKGRARGFTIVELIIVIAVIGILSVISIVAYNGVQRNARDKTVLSDIDAVASEITRYSVKNGGALGSAVAWYSGGAANANIDFTPSPSNVIDVVASNNSYCIRGYNTASNFNSLANASTQESDPSACIALAASAAAGGTGQNNLFGQWKLNGSAIDSGANGYTGTVNGATPITGQDGTTNGAYLFDGVNDNITLTGTNATLPTTFSVSAWVNLATTINTGWNMIVAGSANDFGLGIQNPATPNLRLTKVSWSDAALSTGIIPTQTWHHVALTFSSGTVIYYLDGAPTNTITYANTFTASVKKLGSTGANAGWLNGALDDVRIYSRTLTATEILKIKNAGAQ